MQKTKGGQVVFLYVESLFKYVETCWILKYFCFLLKKGRFARIDFHGGANGYFK